MFLWINANFSEVHAASLFKIQNAGVSEMFVFATLGLTLRKEVMIVFTCVCVQVSDCKEEASWRGPGGGGGPFTGDSGRYVQKVSG